MLNTDPPPLEAKLFEAPQELPQATLILVFGIISIPFCCFCGSIGIVFGIIALVLGGKAKALYMANPTQYTLSSYNNMHAGRICAIVGICLCTLHFIYEVVLLVVYGTIFSTLIFNHQ